MIKSKIVSGSALAAAALALAGATTTPAYARRHKCAMEKRNCGGKSSCKGM